MANLAKAFARWLPVAIAVTAVLLGMSLEIGLALRLSGNDPQIQMAQDAATVLTAGGEAASILPPGLVDLRQSLAPFLIVFDAQGNPVAGSGQLGGGLPELPAGVFDYVRQNGEDRVTWEPEPGVRIAAIVEPIAAPGEGFVLAGRSLREIEARKQTIQSNVLMIWAATMLATLLAGWITQVVVDRGARRH